MKLLGLFKNNEIKLIEKRLETKDSYLFSFEFNPNLQWKPGQNGIFKFKGEKLNGGNFRPFSVASTKEENKITILTKIGDNPSGFKEKLKAMEVGDSIYMSDPLGGFYISDYNRPMAMIAGGIGITPVRSILKDIEAKDIKKVELFYIDSSREYAFKEELEVIEKINQNIKIYFLQDRQDLDSNLSSFINKHNNEAVYFISGSPNMVMDIRKKIGVKGIKRRNIINDSFRGY